METGRANQRGYCGFADEQGRKSSVHSAVSAGCCELDSAHSKELLGVFVSEMFRTVAEQERYEERRQRQEKAKQKAEIFKDKKAPVK